EDRPPLSACLHRGAEDLIAPTLLDYGDDEGEISLALHPSSPFLIRMITPKDNTKMMGARAIRAISPKPSTRGSLPSITDAAPTATDIRNVTAIGPVATPPASKDIPTKSLSLANKRMMARM